MSDPPMSWTLLTYQVLLLVQNVKLLADTYWQIFVNIHLHIDLPNNFDACVLALYHENGQI